MRVSQISLALVALSTSVTAAPIQNEKRWFPGNWWQAEASAPSLLDFIKRHPWPGVFNLNIQTLAGQCDVSKVSLPAGAEALPPVTSGLRLYHVALGRGTQNYTCAPGNMTAAPAPIGAVATLYNATCTSATNTQLLAALPPTTLNLPNPFGASDVFPDVSGHHYFTDKTTAYFNLDTSRTDFGQGAFKKIAAVPAPADAMKGQGGQGNGAVPWLKLVSKDPQDTSCVFTEVYRVNTAGGQPPATCEGMPETFTVEYSAEYYMYSR